MLEKRGDEDSGALACLRCRRGGRKDRKHPDVNCSPTYERTWKSQRQTSPVATPLSHGERKSIRRREGPGSIPLP